MHWPPDLQMRSPAAVNGRANRKTIIGDTHSNARAQVDQGETALGAAMRRALARRLDFRPCEPCRSTGCLPSCLPSAPGIEGSSATGIHEGPPGGGESSRPPSLPVGRRRTPVRGRSGGAPQGVHNDRPAQDAVGQLGSHARCQHAGCRVLRAAARRRCLNCSMPEELAANGREFTRMIANLFF